MIGTRAIAAKSKKIDLLRPFKSALGRKFPGFTYRQSNWRELSVTRPHPLLVSLWCRFPDGCAVRCAIHSPQWSRVSSSLYRTHTVQIKQRTFTKGALRVWV